MKITIFYNQGNRGWTETWYQAGSTPPSTLPAADKNIFAKSIAFRSALTTIEWVRYSVVGKPQLVNSFRLASILAAPPDPTNSPDVVSTDALWRLTTASLARRSISLRGLYDASVIRDPITGRPTPSTFLFDGVNAMLYPIKKAGWLIRKTETVTNSPGLLQTGIAQLAPNVVNPTTQTDLVLTTAIPGLVAGQKVRIYGSIDPRVLPVFPKTPTVKAVLTGGLRLVINYQLPGGLVANPQEMYATQLIYDYEPLDEWAFQSLSSRDTGRPFGSGRGRRTSLGSRR